MKTSLGASEKELHILRAQSIHRFVICIDSGVDHTRLLLLDQYHSALDGIFNTKTRDGAGSSLSNAMATIGRLPLSCRIPPTKNAMLA